jgi:uncharacterized membrane protein
MPVRSAKFAEARSSRCRDSATTGDIGATEEEAMMETPASIARHPLHPMLVGLPIALWFFSLVCDVIVYASNVEEIEILWFTLGYYTLAVGLAGALAAAIPGIVDYRSLILPRHRELASRHLALNLVVITLYAANLWVRSQDPPEFEVAFALSVLGMSLLAVSAWFGGELVHVHGVGVAGHVDSPVRANDLGMSEPSTTRLGHR